MPPKNIMVIQSGGPTAVINRSLSGIMRASRQLYPESRVYGADHGMEGLISGKIPELTNISSIALSSLDSAPGAALGSTRHKLREEDIKPIFDTLDHHNIGILHIIGGNDSALTGVEISAAARRSGYQLQVVNVPKTIDNDLVMTDHCPGYGSTARFISQATLGVGRDALAMGIASPITIMEVMGRDAGWIAASASLYKRDARDPPHFIGVPELPFEEESFLIQIEDAYRRHGYAVAIISENIRGPSGSVIGKSDPWHIDDFGHPYFDSPARILAQKVTERIGVRCRYEKPGTIQRSLIDSTSSTDWAEAHIVGKAAVEAAATGQTDIIVTLERAQSDKYTSRTGSSPLSNVAGKVRILPDQYLPKISGDTSTEFKQYLEPLVGKTLKYPQRLL